MRGNLPKKEPGILENFINNKVYYLALEKNKNSGKTFVLHDGPPYANGDIHAGHALDKILKDIIIRYKTMNGYYAPYVPGWDTHGLPIEKKVQQEKNITKDDVGVTKFREICKDYAIDAVERTAKQFERLGGLGDYRDKSKRYLTLNKDFEAKQIGVFGEMYKKGYIYRDLKPVYWCSDCETALAEAEIEYKDENLLLKNCEDVDAIYINEILPEKMYWNLKGIADFSLFSEWMIMIRTILAVI